MKEKNQQDLQSHKKRLFGEMMNLDVPVLKVKHCMSDEEYRHKKSEKQTE